MSGGVLFKVALGDRAAVEECVARYGGLVWSLARRHSHDLAAAEDAVQEIFIDLWRHAARFDERRASETTFVAMIARRRLVDRRRKDSRSVPTTTLDQGLTLSGSVSVDRLAIQDEVRRAREGIAVLRLEERQVLELALDGGLTNLEIADRLSLPLGTVKTFARRGLHRLRELLSHDSPNTTSEGAKS